MAPRIGRQGFRCNSCSRRSEGLTNRERRMESGIARSGITKEQRKYLKAMQVRSTEGVEVLELRELPDPIGTQEWDSHLPLLHPDDHAEMRRAWSHCLRTGCPGEVSFRARNAEGGYRWFLSRVEPLLASDGTVLYWIGVTLDIDDTKRPMALIPTLISDMWSTRGHRRNRWPDQGGKP
jgi:PAS fold